MESRITPLGDRLYLIDAYMFDDDERLACYLFDTPERVLIECGPSRSIGHLFDALDELGIDDLAAMVVSHIHLDHAGGAGHFARRYPRARIGVHRAGVRHLADPSRLWDSATRIYGEEGMRRMWGPMEPIDRDRLLVLDEGDHIPLGDGHRLEVMYTPGHAKHHVVYFDPSGGGAFIGDSVGIAFPHGHLVQPVTPPPDFDPPLVVEQLRRIAARQPTFLGFAHFGPHVLPQQALAEAEHRLNAWVAFVLGLDDGGPEADWQRLRDWVLDGYRAEGYPDETLAVYDKNTFWPMQAAGVRHWRSRHPEG
jgi:glyoxylase-like metal-dependent hydrolase (beta-lactamase superfamily II)